MLFGVTVQTALSSRSVVTERHIEWDHFSFEQSKPFSENKGGRSLCKQCFPDSLCKTLSIRYRKMNALKQPADEKTLLPPGSAALGLSRSDTGLAIETGYV
jgi:hypothetical protein